MTLRERILVSKRKIQKTRKMELEENSQLLWRIITERFLDYLSIMCDKTEVYILVGEQNILQIRCERSSGENIILDTTTMVDFNASDAEMSYILDEIFQKASSNQMKIATIEFDEVRNRKEKIKIWL